MQQKWFDKRLRKKLIMYNTICIQKNGLPRNGESAINLIYDYFNGFEIECIEHNKYYELKLTANQYTYCEDISIGLEFLDISLSEVCDYCIINDNFALCLSENWLPYAYIKMVSRDNKQKEDFTIIHIDDHKDLMEPFICREQNTFYDMISGKEFNFESVSSIRDAVKSGSITIGSMLSVIAYSMTQIDILHIKKHVETKEYGISKEFISDSMINTHCQRIALAIHSDKKLNNRYFVTSNWKDIRNKVILGKQCILHIDMDYFNNRYNASTDWYKNKSRNDPDLNEQKATIDIMIENIKAIHKVAPIKYVLIGISPSFYPVEFWKDCLSYLLNELKKIGLGIGASVIKCKKE